MSRFERALLRMLFDLARIIVACLSSPGVNNQVEAQRILVEMSKMVVQFDAYKGDDEP